MPKRNRKMSEDAEFGEDQEVDVFWALLPREQRSTSRVL